MGEMYRGELIHVARWALSQHRSPQRPAARTIHVALRTDVVETTVGLLGFELGNAVARSEEWQD